MDGNKFGTIFVTGGAGYIGSHCVVDLLEAGYQVITCDNFSNSVVNSCDAKSLPPSLQRVEELTGKKVTFYPCDLVNYQQLDDIFNQVKTTLFFKKLWFNENYIFIDWLQHKIDCVIHFAAMKSVGESMQVPFIYYKNNLVGTINLIEVMTQFLNQFWLF